MIIKSKQKIRFIKKKGTYAVGTSFTEAKWVSIIAQYHDRMKRAGKCSLQQLAEIASISVALALKAVEFAKKKRQIIIPRRGTPLRGVGSVLGVTCEHHKSSAFVVLISG